MTTINISKSIGSFHSKLLGIGVCVLLQFGLWKTQIKMFLMRFYRVPFGVVELFFTLSMGRFKYSVRTCFFVVFQSIPFHLPGQQWMVGFEFNPTYMMFCFLQATFVVILDLGQNHVLYLFHMHLLLEPVLLLS